jgi:hypothetical protein
VTGLVRVVRGSIGSPPKAGNWKVRSVLRLARDAVEAIA